MFSVALVVSRKHCDLRQAVLAVTWVFSLFDCVSSLHYLFCMGIRFYSNISDNRFSVNLRRVPRYLDSLLLGY